MLLQRLALATALLAMALPARSDLTGTALMRPASTTKAQLLMNAPRPLFFSDLVAFDTAQHRALTLPAQRKDFAFAANAHLLPLTMAEASPAGQNYPVVFVQEGDTVVLVALTGLPNTGNRFVDAKGEWRAGAYIPAYVRGYPFIAVRPAKDAEPIIAFDPTAADFKAKDGVPLVDSDGQATEQFKGILAFHAEYQALIERTQKMTQALKAEGVLEEGHINLQTPDGKANQIGGFLVVNEGKLRTLSAEALKRLMDADAIGLAYLHLFSMNNLGQLIAEAPSTAKSRRPSGK